MMLRYLKKKIGGPEKSILRSAAKKRVWTLNSRIEIAGR